jgi:hypothetical protein
MVLDLSICWVCGEYIVRGNEVVSLAWCFWHQECFGCLVCGERLALPDLKRAKKWGFWDGRGRRKGVELESVPLCRACEHEMLAEDAEKEREKERERERERNLTQVVGLDGGVAMVGEREDMLMHEEDERRVESTRWGNSKRALGSSRFERDLSIFINGGSIEHNVSLSALNTIDSNADS